MGCKKNKAHDEDNPVNKPMPLKKQLKTFRLPFASACLAMGLLLQLPVQAEYALEVENLRLTTSSNTQSKALYLAQEKALEAISGTYFQGRTGVRNYKMILPYLMPQRDQFLEAVRIVRENKDPKSKLVSIDSEVPVKVKALTQSLDQILNQLDQLKARQKILVVVDEEQDRRKPYASDLQAHVEQFLIEKNFYVLDASASQSANDQQNRLIQALSKNDPSWRQLARQLGADRLVRVIADFDTELRDQQVVGNRVVKPGYFVGSGNISTEVLDVQTGRKRSHYLLKLNQTAGQRKALFAQLAQKAAQDVGPWANDTLIGVMLTELQPVQKVRYLLSGVENYAREAQPFMELLRAQKGVSELQALSLDEGQLEMEFVYQGQLMDLEHDFLPKALQLPGLSSLNKRSSAERISHFEIVRPKPSSGK